MGNYVGPKNYTKRERLEILRAQLENEKASFRAHWQDLGNYILPRRPRWFTGDANQGDRRNTKIIDSTATLASRTLRAGMMGGVTSPARPWFRLTTPDPDIAEEGAVKEWLSTVSTRMSTVFLRSNLYNALPIVYGDIGTFATSSMIVEEDFDEVIRCYPFPIGSYAIANNDRLKVNVFYHEYRMTVRQLLEKFAKKTNDGYDLSNFSDTVKTAYENGHMETWIDVCHFITPNDEYDEDRAESKYKKFKSCYYEKGFIGTGNNTSYMQPGYDKFLRESGYDYFPVLCPRWETTGEDTYGTSCPGMEALGDIRQLQLGEKRSMQAIEKMVMPPLTGPTSLRTTRVSLLPGDISYNDEREGQRGLRPIHEVNPRINELEGKQEQVRIRIKRAFYEDLFLMLANTDRREITAREVEERHEEKLLALGPVLEQLNQDLLDPLIDITFDIMLRQGLIPEPPEQLQGVKLKVEYISVMAQAQKLIGIAGVERFAGFVGNIATQIQDPSVMDKVDIDQMIDVYGDLTSVPPGIIRTDEDVEAIRAQRAQAQQAAVMPTMARDAAGAAKDLSQADTEGKNALTDILRVAQAGQIAPQ